MLTIELKQKFLVLASKISPENLSCDGMLSRAEQQRKYNRYMREWTALEHQAKCLVEEEEPYNWIAEIESANLPLY